MRLSLAKIIDCPGASASFETTLDLRDMEFGAIRPVQSPVSAKGIVRNTAGVLTMTGHVDTTLDCICDRCAKPFTEDISYPIDAVLVTEVQQEDFLDENCFLLQGNDADLDEIVTTTFVLNMDSKMLCRPDCKGLCPTCGKDLNDGACDCRPEPDPRLAALQKFFEK
ncbi:MAG: DUF177 domain-containing protein [Oscillospiraceae bacterium]|nr:DUF177 domain-containing protein [Oscillospiraceae bacterium]